MPAMVLSDAWIARWWVRLNLTIARGVVEGGKSARNRRFCDTPHRDDALPGPVRRLEAPVSTIRAAADHSGGVCDEDVLAGGVAISQADGVGGGLWRRALCHA